MKNLLSIICAILPLLSVFGQWPQGAGEDLVAITTAGGHLYAIRDGAEDIEIIRSTDGGISFDVLHTETNPLDELRAIAVDGNVGFSGGGSLLLRAGNLSGDPQGWVEVDWDAQGLSAPFNLLSIAGNGTGTWAVLDDSGMIYQTIDNGTNWTDISLDGTFLSAINWDSVTSNWVAVGGDKLYEYDGSDWTPSVIDAGSMVTAIAVDGAGNVLVAGENGALYMRNAGAAEFTSLEATDGSSENFTTLLVLDENEFVVGGDQRGLIRVSGGIASILLPTQEGPVTVNQITQIDGAVVMAGVAMVEPPDIQAVNDPTQPVEVSLVATDPGHSLFYSTDGSDPRGNLPGQVFAYTAPFTVTGTVTVRAVTLGNGIYSAVVEREIQAGEILQPFLITIQVGAGEVVMTQDMATEGYTFGLEYTTNLLADPLVWDGEDHANQVGTGSELTWTVAPVPASPRFWRVVVIEE
ncbi:MAG: chitobiase/beta-hexosaminidase C-terminal domain-containing protein [Kiritimatiellae bacterium]|jgi:photosystem II stability/assembly factor-like uncharacterized protein|nr:chitobiase/beta-hexosaminidase C-terminal domain-containing protein [Kiritimatiellia bacterium]